MTKNIKRMFFVLTLVTLLATVGAVCAANDANTTTAVDSSVSDATVSDSASDTIVAETVTTTSKDKINTKTIEKEDKNLKKDSITINGIEYTEVIENQEINDGFYEEAFINNCTVSGSSIYFEDRGYLNNTICNAPVESYEIYINNSVVNAGAYLMGQTYVYNSTLNGTIINQGTLVLDDNSIISYDATIDNTGTILSNNTNVLYILGELNLEDAILSDMSMDRSVTNNGQLTLKNVTLNSLIRNNGKLIISDDCIPTDNFRLCGNGEVITNLTFSDNVYNTTKIVEANNWNEVQSAITGSVQDNKHDTYIINLNNGTYNIPTYSYLNDISSNIIINGNGQRLGPQRSYVEMNINKGNMTFNDLTLDHINIIHGATLILNNIIFEFGSIDNSKTTELNNVTFNDGSITNEEDSTLTIRNSTLNIHISNDGTVEIADDVIFGEEFTIDGGNIIISDPNRLTPYLTEFNGDYILENTEINRYISNYGNLTLKNVTVNRVIANSGNLILKNCTMNNGIANDAGTITIADDVILSSNFYIARDIGEIISNITDIIMYISQLNGDYVIENQVITHLSQNNGNLTIRNSTFNNTDYLTNNGNMTIEDLILNKPITNNGNLTVKNMTLNSTISLNNYNQYGSTLIIADDVIIGDGLKITNGNTGNINNPPGTIIIDDYSRIFKYMNNFKYEAVVELGDYTKEIYNYGNLTIENTTFSAQLSPDNRAILNNIRNSAKIIIINSTTNTKNSFSNTGTMEFYNSSIDLWISNSGTLIISEDSLIGENFKITGNGEILTNNTRLLIDYVNIWETDTVITNETINTPKTNYGTITLNNCTINSTITNEGTIIISDNTLFTENAKITGYGKIETNNITKLLPFIDTINGNYEIKDTILNKSYTFNGEITLTNCTINNPDNTNIGKLNLNNCSVDVGEDNTFLTNFGTIKISKDTNIVGKIANITDNGAYIINQDTIEYFFNEKGLTSIVKPGDTLDIQGTINTLPALTNLVINKPVNIITSTNNGRIENFNSITYDNGASGSNVTGIYTYNTQFYVKNAHNIIFDNISNVVISKGVGWGVGQTSIRENSTNITVKNSYFYTKDNGGSSTFVLAWADNCTLINSTIEADGYVGNLLYLTTFNVEVPEGVVPNCNNQIQGNVIIGPEQSSSICVAIMLSGANNTIGNNLVYYVGGGIDGQWTGEGYSDTQNNTFFNNTQKYGKPKIELIVDTTTFTAGENTTIKASIYYTNKIQTDINKGKVTFKVNGKTLKDANGKVIYAKVVNGTATIENYEVPQDWAKEGTTIQAVYSGSTQCKKLTSKKTNITVAAPEATLVITPITDDIQTGSTVTLKAKVAAGDKAITTGKIVFKINGKTVKDENGKVIYAKVDANGEVSVDYNLGNLKAGSYTIEATFISPNYDKITSNTTMTVVKA